MSLSLTNFRMRYNLFLRLRMVKILSFKILLTGIFIKRLLYSKKLDESRKCQLFQKVERPSPKSGSSRIILTSTTYWSNLNSPKDQISSRQCLSLMDDVKYSKSKPRINTTLSWKELDNRFQATTNILDSSSRQRVWFTLV